MKRVILAAGAALAVGHGVRAQSVEFRVVERTGQAFVTAADPILDFAVQARVTGGALGTFAFDIVMPGEADSNGTLSKGVISNDDGTYATIISAAPIGTVGRHGLARTYTYLAGLSASFNGVINTSTGTFTNTPENQEIGLIVGDALGTPLFTTPGLDPAGEGNPGTWSGYGSGGVPNPDDTAAISPTVGGPYLAQGQFIDVYRFRYTVTNLVCRPIVVTLRGVQAAVGTQFVYQNGVWSVTPATVPGGLVTVTPFTIADCPAPGTGAVVVVGGVWASRRRRAAAR